MLSHFQRRENETCGKGRPCCRPCHNLASLAHILLFDAKLHKGIAE
jgi:hypothetical protein